jgi:hypothetical protein
VKPSATANSPNGIETTKSFCRKMILPDLLTVTEIRVHPLDRRNLRSLNQSVDDSVADAASVRAAAGNIRHVRRSSRIHIGAVA